MAEFMAINQSLVRQSINSSAGFFGINKWGVKGMMPGSYILSDGTLPSICPDLSTLSVDGASKIAVIDVAYGNSIAEICEEFNMKQYGDMATICVAYPKKDGSYGFGAVRFTFKQGADVANSFELAIDGDIVAASFNFAANKIALTIKTAFDWADGADAEHTYTAAIAMQYRNGKYMYTEKQMVNRIRRRWFSIKRHKGFDILLTHAPARHLNDLETIPHRGFECFNDLLDKYHPRLFVHGHVHLSYNHRIPQECTRGETTVVNAYDYYVIELD